MQRYFTIALLLLSFTTSYAMEESKETTQEQEHLFISHTIIASILKQNNLNLCKAWTNAFERKKTKDFDTINYLEFSHNLQETIKKKFNRIADHFDNDSQDNHVSFNKFDTLSLIDWSLLNEDTFKTDTKNISHLISQHHTSKRINCSEDGKIYLCDILHAIETLSAEYFTICSIEKRLKNALKSKAPLNDNALRRMPMIYITIHKNTEQNCLVLKAYPYASQHNLTYTPIDEYDNPYPLMPYTWGQRAKQYLLGAAVLVGVTSVALLAHWFFTGFVGAFKNLTHNESIDSQDNQPEAQCADKISFANGDDPITYDLVKFRDTQEIGFCTSPTDCYHINHQSCSITLFPSENCRANYKLCSHD